MKPLRTDSRQEPLATLDESCALTGDMQLLDLDAIEGGAVVRRRNRRPRQIWLVNWSPAGTLYGAYFVASDSERVTGIEPAPSARAMRGCLAGPRREATHRVIHMCVPAARLTCAITTARCVPKRMHHRPERLALRGANHPRTLRRGKDVVGD
jgi:hypothetical protein